MRTRVQTERVVLVALRDVEIEKGVVLPAGSYPGLEGYGGVSRARPSYLLERTSAPSATPGFAGSRFNQAASIGLFTRVAVWPLRCAAASS